MLELGAQRRVYTLCDSSNERLWHWIAQGARPGAVLLAHAQSAGRGRQGRSWLSEAGQGLYVSLYLTPRLAARELPALGLLAALALCDALSELGLQRHGIKWPNDLLWDGRKLAGTLVEARGSQIVLGIGLNLHTPQAGWPAELSAVALREAGLALRPIELVQPLCRALALRLAGAETNGVATALADFAALDLLRGREIRYSVGERTLEGRADGLDATGALRVLDARDRVQLLHAGEVHLLR